MSCCDGLEPCLKDWDDDGRWYFLCKADGCQGETSAPTTSPTPAPTTMEPTPAPTQALVTCTEENDDPWRTGEEVSCCQGLESCLRNWDGDGRWFFLCKAQCTD